MQAMDEITEERKHQTTLILWLCVQTNTSLGLVYFRIKQAASLGIVLHVRNARCSFSVMPNPLALTPWRVAEIYLGRCLNSCCCALALRARADDRFKT